MLCPHLSESKRSFFFPLALRCCCQYSFLPKHFLFDDSPQKESIKHRFFSPPFAYKTRRKAQLRLCSVFFVMLLLCRCFDSVAPSHKRPTLSSLIACSRTPGKEKTQPSSDVTPPNKENKNKTKTKTNKQNGRHIYLLHFLSLHQFHVFVDIPPPTREQSAPPRESKH